MNRMLRLLLLSGLVLALGLGAVGCGEDDDDDNIIASEEELVGTWTLSRVLVDGTEHTGAYVYNHTLILDPGGTGTAIDDSDGSEEITWELDGNRFRMTGSDSFEGPFLLAGDILEIQTDITLEGGTVEALVLYARGNN